MLIYYGGQHGQSGYWRHAIREVFGDFSPALKCSVWIFFNQQQQLFVY
ncbi:MAG: hypothetical protein R3Y10_01460 [Ferrimonas sp.]